MNELELFFESTVKIARTKVGKRQTIETLINEEILLFAQLLRSWKEWKPRIRDY